MTTPVVVFGEDWAGHPSSTQHLIGRILHDRNIVWINSIGLRRPQLRAKDFKRVADKLLSSLHPGPRGRQGRSRPLQGRANPQVVIEPLGIPVPRNRPERWLNRRLLRQRLQPVLKKLAINEPILWISLPTAVDLLECADEKSVVYYCGDDFSGLAGVDHGPVAAAEARLVERATLIFAASEELARRFPAEKTVFLPHGVDWDLFASPTKAPLDLPSDRRIAGFYGSISDWLDTALLADVAKCLPDWEFVFIGDIHIDVSALREIRNIRFLGPRPHHALPGYVQNWDVSLLPFKDNAQIRACNPLKLREYLAAGTPIVSTPFPALEPYRDHISVAACAAPFAAAIAGTMAEPMTKRVARQDCVKTESWTARAAVVAHHLDRL
jgi:glycosyltransferase involved in cell wall biosynthesis